MYFVAKFQVFNNIPFYLLVKNVLVLTAACRNVTKTTKWLNYRPSKNWQLWTFGRCLSCCHWCRPHFWFHCCPPLINQRRSRSKQSPMTHAGSAVVARHTPCEIPPASVLRTLNWNIIKSSLIACFAVNLKWPSETNTGRVFKILPWYLQDLGMVSMNKHDHRKASNIFHVSRQGWRA